MKKIIAILLTTILTFSLAACDSLKEGGTIDRNFVAIESDTALGSNYRGLVYYKETGIIYIYIIESNLSSCAVYLSENGLPCRYIDGEIVEINNNKGD